MTDKSSRDILDRLLDLCRTWTDLTSAVVIVICIISMGYTEVAPLWNFDVGDTVHIQQLVWGFMLAAVMTMTAFIFEFMSLMVENSSVEEGAAEIRCEDSKVMMMVYFMLSLSYFKMALDPLRWVHTDPLAYGGPRPVYTIRFLEWSICMPLLLALSGNPELEEGESDDSRSGTQGRRKSWCMQQVNMLASIPVVVSSRLRNMAIAPSARCTCIYIWSSWLALTVVDEFTRWLLLCVSFAAYAVAALEQLAQVSILRTTKENAEWAPLLLFQVVLAGIYGVVYLGAVLNCYSWRTEQLLYSFADVSAKFLHSCFTMSLRRKNKLQQLSLLRQAAVNAATDLQCMIRQANVPIFVVNMQLEVVDWNLKTAQVTGIPHHEAVGKYLPDLASGDELASWGLTAGSLLQDAMDELEPNVVEMNFKDVNDQTRESVMAISATCLRTGSGNVRGAVCIGQDISAITSERRRAQRLADGLNRLIVSANAPIFQVDLSDNIVIWNKWLENATGLSRDSTLGCHISEVLSPGSKKKFQDACRKVLNYCDAERFEVNLVNQEDQKITLLLTATPCVAVSGEISGAICIGQDITRLKDLDERKASMMAMVSHELKSPLHGILGLCSSLMGDTNLDASRVGTSLSAMYSCANRLLDMVANIMDTSVLVNDKKMRMSKDPVQMKDIIQEVVTLCLVATSGKDGQPMLRPGVQIINNVKEPLPIIEADAYRCTQLVYNLITNAMKFTHDGSIVISCGFNDDEQVVCTEIEDTGIGIAAENVDRIFEPFDQEDTSESRRYSGLGLGLSISREVARKHGGDLVVESQQGVGSTFRFTLPYKMKQWPGEEAEDNDSSPPPRMPAALSLRAEQSGVTKKKKKQKKATEIAGNPAVAARTLTAQSRNSSSSLATAKSSPEAGTSRPPILCVDDDPVHLETITHLLKMDRYEVHVVSHGLAALEFLISRPASLLLLDVMMPEMSGQHVLKVVRKLYTKEQLPVIVISALSSQESIRELLALGANEYIMKPFGRDEILKSVREQLSIRSLATQDRMQQLTQPSTQSAGVVSDAVVEGLFKEMEHIRADRDAALERTAKLQKRVEELEEMLGKSRRFELTEEQLQFLQKCCSRQKVLQQYHDGIAQQISRMELQQRMQQKILNSVTAVTSPTKDQAAGIETPGIFRGSFLPPAANPYFLQICQVEEKLMHNLKCIEELAAKLPDAARDELQSLVLELRGETNSLLIGMGTTCHQLACADGRLEHQVQQLQRTILPQLRIAADPYAASLSMWPPSQTTV